MKYPVDIVLIRSKLEIAGITFSAEALDAFQQQLWYAAAEALTEAVEKNIIPRTIRFVGRVEINEKVPK